MAMDLSRLEAAVARSTTVKDSVRVLLAQLSQALRDASADPAAVVAIADALDANHAAIEADVVANTPVGPPAVP